MSSRKAKAIMAALRAAMPYMERMDLKRHRRTQDSIGLLVKPAKGTVFKDVKIGDIKGSWIIPPQLRKNIKKADVAGGELAGIKVIMHCHGGAFISGSLKYSKVFAARVAAVTGQVVFTYEYRLAPEHPFPAALEDTIAAYKYLLEKGCQPENITLIGESAGGNLCLAMLLAGREQGLPFPRVLVLLSPWLDLTGSGETFYSLADKDPSLKPDSLIHSALFYAGGRDRQEPLISPLYGDFSAFPPTLVQVGTNEILLSDATRLHEKMKSQGVEVELQIFDEMFHVFQVVDIPESRDAMEKIREFISSH